MVVICRPCREAVEARTSHVDCLGKTHCDCQHKGSPDPQPSDEVINTITKVNADIVGDLGKWKPRGLDPARLFRITKP